LLLYKKATLRYIYFLCCSWS